MVYGASSNGGKRSRLAELLHHRFHTQHLFSTNVAITALHVAALRTVGEALRKQVLPAILGREDMQDRHA